MVRQPMITKLLATAIVKIQSPTATIRARLLVDIGSETTFVLEEVINRLQLIRKRSVVQVYEIGGKTSILSKVYAHILESLTTTLPSFNTKPDWPHLKHLTLADPEYFIPRSIDIVLGADVYGKIIRPDIIKGAPSMPIAQLTIFGWLIIGPANSTNNVNTVTFHTTTQMMEEDLHELLTKFWVQEEVPKTLDCRYTLEELWCEEFYKATYSRDSTGMYTVRIPIKLLINNLGNSYNKAHQCLISLFKRLSRDDNYHEHYGNFMNEYIELEHLTKVNPVSSNTPHYYLRHHGVFKPDSATTKLRVVFNGSSLTTSGY
ncbi:PREDICTED: uncharacterized protein LOC105365607 [Ceratosolen solmsi marchali]|uniref:Uncharacterized protein LOC105365607 n=1 Tax=Ceratosolen solmsi marchali TaxID=326594 RepID=A0AAJ7DZG8_9HYME|nr:PREDICTED: uncharacterized protein LOC105365607 [Ceratosolen solmsi marchali]